jgi:hypothetical protein
MKCLSGVGKRQGPRGPPKQCRPQLGFEAPDLLADGRGRQRQLASGPPDGAVFAHNTRDGIFADSLSSEIVTPVGSASGGYAATFQVAISV